MHFKHWLAALAGLCSMAGAAQAEPVDNGTVSVGVEGFADHYREPSVQVDSHADYGAVTAGYTYGPGLLFGAVDGRASYGNDNYKSPSGTSDNVPQLEFEARLRGGLNLALGGGVFKPYVGIGSRLYYDRGKSTATNLGALGYDRRIAQLYVPLGVTYAFTIGSWTLAPTLEYDPLIWGNVNSRLRDIGYYNLNNTQKSGYGIRGEFMVGQQLKNYAWQLGPFFRYWNIKQSAISYQPDGSYGYEPQNTRLQVGGALRLLF